MRVLPVGSGAVHAARSREPASGEGARGDELGVDDVERARVLSLQRRMGNGAVARVLQRAPHDRPASTDVADTSGGSGHGHAGGKAPAKTAEDYHVRVMAISVDHGKTKVTFSWHDGVTVGMTGALLKDDGKPYISFTIDSVEGGRISSHVDAIPDEVSHHDNAVIYASSSQAGKEF